MRRRVKWVCLLTAAAAVAGFWTAPGAGQMRVAPIDTMAGHAALGLALRHLSNTGIFMMATAHPDDENNGLLVALNRGQGIRTALATATRGNGGQNEIGPELFEPLGVLRTAELAALHRFDGAEQYFTRAVDFGYTIDIPETLQKWGRDEIIGDYVRLIRTVRPDVISAQSPNATGPGQHAHHATAAILSREAYKLAGDPMKYPEQLRDGLRAWQPKKFYNAAGAGSVGFAEAGAQGAAPAVPERVCRVTLDVYDALLGRTYSEIGTEARSMHKCQGQAQLLALPASSTTALQLTETTIPGQMDRDERSLFDGVDTTIAGLAQFAGARVPRELTDGLAAIASAVQLAQQQFDAAGDEAALSPLLAAFRATLALDRQLAGLTMDEAARFEIQFRLKQKEQEFQQAILLANAIRVDVLADDGVVVPGQPLRVNMIVANRGGADFTVKQTTLNGFADAGACTMTANGGRGGGRGGGGGAARGAPAAGAPGGQRGGARGGAAAPAGARGGAGAPGRGAGGGRGRGAGPQEDPVISVFRRNQVGGCSMTANIPATARMTEPYWHRDGEAGRYTFDADAPFGLPQRPTPFSVAVTFAFASGEDVTSTFPVEYRYEGDIFSGEKRSELLVVPAFSVRVSPDVLVVPTARPASQERDLRIAVINGVRGAATSVVRLQLPAGWTSTPAEQPVSFVRQDEAQTVLFRLRAPSSARAGALQIKATAVSTGATYSRGYQVIEYPHIRRQHIFEDAQVAVKLFDVKTAPNLTVGYVMGAGDEGPAALAQLGARVVMLGPDDLAAGNLAQFSTIVLGVRAYEHRDDLVAHNSRLLEYVSNGGTLIVQYNRDAFNAAQYGPYPANVSGDRVTDERAPVTILQPSHPVFMTPNRIGDRAWQGWVQERGLQFLGERDPRYRDLVELEDSFPNNPGKKRGALVEAQYGKGRWIYVGLGLWRELPAGVEGAYELMANLISLGH